MKSLISRKAIIMVFSLCSVLASACIPEFPAESPYDPETPEAQQAKARIQGKIQTESSIDLTQVQVLAEGQGAIASADALGQFTAELAAGEYELSIQAPKHQTLNLGRLALTTGQVRDFGLIKLNAQYGSLEGLVSIPGTNNLSGTLVSVSDVNRSVFTDAMGQFSLNEIPIGEYQITFLREGFVTKLIEGIEVVEAQTTTIGVSLQRLPKDSDFAINSNAPFTKDRIVTLNLAGFDYDRVQASESNRFAGVEQTTTEIVDAAASFELSAGDGEKRVYVRFTNNTTAPYQFSQVYSARIILDQTPPAVLSMSLADDLSFTSRPDVSLVLAAFDQHAGIKEMQLVLDGTADSEPWQPYALVSNITLDASATDGEKTVQVRIRDAIGNESGLEQGTIILDTQTPTVSGAGVLINGSDTHTNRRQVSLMFDVSGASQVKVYNQGATTIASWESYPNAGQMPWMLPVPTGSSATGETMTVIAQFRDEAGNETSSYSADIQLDIHAPQARTLALAGGSLATNQTQASLAVSPALTGTDLRIVLEGPIQEAGAYTAATLPASINLLGADGEKMVYASLVDAAGNESPQFSASVLLDRNPPAAGLVRLANGAAAVNQTQIDFRLVPSILGSNLSVRLSGDVLEAGTTYAAANVPSQLNLTTSDGTKTVSAVLIDPAGNESVAFYSEIELDTVAPVVSGAGVSINGGDSHTNQRPVVLSFTVTGASEVKVRNQAASSTAVYQAHPANHQLSWNLYPLSTSISNGETKTVLVQFKDDAGNESAELSASIVLDQVAPQTRNLVLASGSVATGTNAISLSFSPSLVGTSLAVLLGGDTNEAATYDAQSVPASITLSGSDGVKVISAVLVDQAGNASLPFSSTILLDTIAPSFDPVDVVLAEGRTVVNDRNLAISIRNINPETMSFWEAGTTACGDPVCGSSGFSLFSPATTLLLSENRGTKSVCWKFCDQAQNGSVVGSRDIELGTYLPRPQPILTQISPASYIAYSQSSYSLTVTGQGIAFDTQVHVGAFVYACNTQGGGGMDCQADNGGGCSAVGLCASSCSNTCTVTLDDNVMENSGTYVVRLQTPDPVFNGLNRSADVVFFSVVAPRPEIVSISPRGMVEQTDELGVPIPQTVNMRIRATNATNNVSFRLGQNFGRIVSRTPVDCTGQINCVDGSDDFVVALDSSGLIAGDLVETEVVALNPPPGGGESSPMPFGVSPHASPCVSSQCDSVLRRTRVSVGTREGDQIMAGPVSADATVFRGVEQSYQIEDQSMMYVTPSYFGADAVSVSAGQSGDLVGPDSVYLESLIAAGARVKSVHSGAQIPFLFPPISTQSSEPHKANLRFEAESSDARALRVYSPTQSRATGRYRRVRIGLWEPGLADIDGNEIVSTRLDNGGLPDFAIKLGTKLYLGAGDDSFETSYREIDLGTTAVLALKDMNADGRIDVVGIEQQTEVLVVMSGDGQGGFASPVRSPGITLDTTTQVGDMNNDGLPDIVEFSDARIYVYMNLGGFRFELSANESIYSLYDDSTWYRNTDPSRLAEPVDLNDDGFLDVVLMLLLDNHSSNQLGRTIFSVAYGDGNGGLGPLQALSTQDFTTSFSNIILSGCRESIPQFADLNVDGLKDMVVVCATEDAEDFYDRPSAPWVFLQNPNGGFHAPLIAPVPSDRSNVSFPNVIVRDLNRDSHPDLVVTRRPSEYEIGFLAYYGRGDGRFSEPEVLASSTNLNEGGPSDLLQVFALDSVDVNMDGHLDFVGLVNGWGLAVYVAETSAGGAGLQGEVAPVDTSAVVSDIDRDGHYDFVWNDQMDLFTLLGNTDLTFQSALSSPPGSLDIEAGRTHSVGDLDDDGDTDIVLSGRTGNLSGIQVLGGDHSGQFTVLNWWSQGQLTDLLTGQALLTICDLGGDGRPEILGYAGSQISVYEFDSSLQRFESVGQVNVTSGQIPDSIDTRAAFCADLNLDGDNDLVINRRSFPNPIAGEPGPLFLLGNGDHTLTEVAVLGVPSGVPVMTGMVESVTDINRDGFVDLLLRKTTCSIKGLAIEYGNSNLFRLSLSTPLQAFTEQSLACGGAGHADISRRAEAVSADLDGDGLSDQIRLVTSPDTRIELFANETMGRQYDGAGSFMSDFTYSSVFAPTVSTAPQTPPQVFDLNRDQTPDILIDGRFWVLPSARTWTQELSNMPPMSIAVDPGLSRFRVFQRRHHIEKLALRVFVRGQAVEDLQLALRAPNGGDLVNLPSAPPGATEWNTSYVTELDSFLGWQKTGAWALEVTNTGTLSAELVDFRIITHGSFYRPMVGSSTSNPDLVVLRSAASGTRLKGTTTSKPDRVDVSCATTSTMGDDRGPGEYWYEFTLLSSNSLTIGGGTEFPAAVELRSGSCAGFSQASMVNNACDHNEGVGNPLEISNLNLSAGTYCMVVDGIYDAVNDLRHNGRFDLSLKFDAAFPAVCGDGQVAGTEVCDDGNLVNGDGCSDACSIEATWVCSGDPSLCSQPQVCSDGLIVGTEQCDDGNFINNDGCTSNCEVEPGWTCVGSPSVCTHPVVCGDGVLVAPEVCDDTNLVNGDGCSDSCTIDAGWGCDGVPSVCIMLESEQEPNDQISEANLSGIAGAGLATMSGTVQTGGDFDYFSISVPPGTFTLDAQTYGTIGNITSCNGDSRLALFDPNGTELAADDDDGFNVCSAIQQVISNTSGSSQTYYLRVRGYESGTPTFNYYLLINLQ